MKLEEAIETIQSHIPINIEPFSNWANFVDCVYTLIDAASESSLQKARKWDNFKYKLEDLHTDCTDAMISWGKQRGCMAEQKRARHFRDAVEMVIDTYDKEQEKT